MTAFSETRKVAHVMMWRGSGDWLSLCRDHGRSMDNVSDYPLIKFLGGSYPAREKPWCTRCVRVLREMAAEVLDGLL